MSWAIIARWICAVPLFVSTSAVLSRKETAPESPKASRFAFIWLVLKSTCNVAVIFALFNDRLNVALILWFGWNALSALQKCMSPDKKVDQEERGELANYRRKYERFLRLDGILQPVFFVLLVTAIELRSIPLSSILFVSIIGYSTVSFLRMSNEMFPIVLDLQ